MKTSDAMTICAVVVAGLLMAGAFGELLSQAARIDGDSDMPACVDCDAADRRDGGVSDD